MLFNKLELSHMYTLYQTHLSYILIFITFLDPILSFQADRVPLHTKMLIYPLPWFYYSMHVFLHVPHPLVQVLLWGKSLPEDVPGQHHSELTSPDLATLPARALPILAPSSSNGGFLTFTLYMV